MLINTLIIRTVTIPPHTAAKIFHISIFHTFTIYSLFHVQYCQSLHIMNQPTSLLKIHLQQQQQIVG